MTTYEVDVEHLTVIAVDDTGERHDLNAAGEPCRSIDDLGMLIRELEVAGVITPATCASMLAELDD